MSRGYLLDTNVVSETRKIGADAGVVAFLEAQPSSALFLSVLTIGELRKGVAIKRRSNQDAARKISAWIDATEGSFRDRILPVDHRVARLWGELSADRTRPVIDTLIAATALVDNLVLVTRNTMDVSGLALTILNPFLGKGLRG